MGAGKIRFFLDNFRQHYCPFETLGLSSNIMNSSVRVP
jgi:hypothetical protein